MLLSQYTPDSEPSAKAWVLILRNSRVCCCQITEYMIVHGEIQTLGQYLVDRG
jgi:hypothetical protein